MSYFPIFKEGVIYHACTSTPLYQSAHNTTFKVCSFTNLEDMIGS